MASRFQLVRSVLAVISLLGMTMLRAQTPVAATPSSANRFALLIGIDTYEPPKGSAGGPPAGIPAVGRFAYGEGFHDLHGPQNDVQAMRSLLTTRFGFPADDQHIHQLMDRDATRAAILEALDKYVAHGEKGSTVVLYISSHGSLRVNDAGEGQTYQLAGETHKLDGTIVPADAWQGKDDITSGDLREKLMAAARNGVQLTVIIDSCHSGGQARGVDDHRFIKRSIAWDDRPLNQPVPKNPDGSLAPGPQDIEENPVLILSAAQKDQLAMEDESPKPHGVFTQALIRSLQALPPTAKASDVFQRVLVEMELDGPGNQQPALDTTAKRKQQPLFGGNIEKGPRRANIVSINEDGNAILDIGKIADIGPGSEFTQINAVHGVKAVLTISQSLGLERSEAVLAAKATQAGAKISPKDVFELTKWVPADNPKFKFYSGQSNLSLSELQTAAAVVSATSISLVRDPSTDPWTHVVGWNGKTWTLQARSLTGTLSTSARPPVFELGAKLTTAALTSHLHPPDILWFNAPLPSELAQLPGLHDPNNSAQFTEDRSQSAYVIAGNLADSGLTFAWYNRGDFDADVQTPKGLSRGCSPNSPYPLRTDWVPAVAETSSATDPERTPGFLLTQSAQRLAKLNGWLTLKSPSNGSTPFDYTLGLQRQDDHKLRPDGSQTYKDERYGLTLNGSIDYSGPSRWVYVLGIDCQGNGVLLWPRDGPGGKFPTANGRLASIPLPGITFRITPPYGTDTYLLLTTSSELPEPDVLNFEGVVRGGSRGAGGGPLEDLLRATSSGTTRGNGIPTPTDWGIQLVQMHSTASKPPDQTK